jgi:hypothetical protein
MKRGATHSIETKAALAEKARVRMNAAERAKIGETTKARMADPAVRQRIKDGMRLASGETDELQLLQAAWRATRPIVRSRFLNELFFAGVFRVRTR